MEENIHMIYGKRNKYYLAKNPFNNINNMSTLQQLQNHVT